MSQIIITLTSDIGGRIGEFCRRGLRLHGAAVGRRYTSLSEVQNAVVKARCVKTELAISYRRPREIENLRTTLQEQRQPTTWTGPCMVSTYTRRVSKVLFRVECPASLIVDSEWGTQAMPVLLQVASSESLAAGSVPQHATVRRHPQCASDREQKPGRDARELETQNE